MHRTGNGMGKPRAFAYTGGGSDVLLTPVKKTAHAGGSASIDSKEKGGRDETGRGHLGGRGQIHVTKIQLSVLSKGTPNQDGVMTSGPNDRRVNIAIYRISKRDILNSKRAPLTRIIRNMYGLKRARIWPQIIQNQA